jgi:hypothetical protein
MQHVQNIQYGYLLNKCLKHSVWRLAVQCDIYMYAVRRLKVNCWSLIVHHALAVTLYFRLRTSDNRKSAPVSIAVASSTVLYYSEIN